MVDLISAIRRARAPLAVLVLSACAACADNGTAADPGTVDAAAAAEGSALAPAVVSQSERVADAERSLREDFGAVYEAWLASEVSPDALRFVLLDEDPPLRVRRSAFLAALYDARDWHPVFVNADGLAVRGDAVRDGIAAATEHALDPDDYLNAAAHDAISAFEQLAWTYRHRTRLSPSDDEVDAIVDLLQRADIIASADPATAALSAALEEGADVAPELRAAHVERLRLERAFRGAEAIAEVALADGILAYAFDQGAFNTATLPSRHTEAEEHEEIARRLRAVFDGMVAADDRATADAVVAAAAPRQPQYALLVAERARYAALAANGGWARIEPRSLSRGHTHPRVAELKQRLAVEGYYDGPIDERFDEALENAVSTYQTTHQMEVTGESSRGFWTSLNVPAEDRLAQIELTMQRWRESRIGDDPYYVFVNVPDFHAEVWRDGVRQMRFKVVVGNTDRVCDTSTGQWRYANATPLQSANMSYVVLNPHWNIPRRILEEELIPNLMEDEEYFEVQGIERFINDNGDEIIRQLPGPNNPLGRVKFMFPNPHNTYLHDTSRPQYFRYPIRAFSHGCMRVETPIELLEQLLRNDGQWDQDRVDRIFEQGDEFAMTLNTAVPVHIEYYVVRVDDDGRANFLADVYRYDRDRMSPPDASDTRCTPEPESAYDLVLGEDMRPMFRDAEGNLIDPNEAVPVTPDAADDPAAGDFGP